MPAEWAKHRSTWFSWPHNIETWPLDGKYQAMITAYCEIILTLAQYEEVNINVCDAELENKAKEYLLKQGAKEFSNIKFHHFKTNDAWCRDHGPIFVKDEENQNVALNWEYNAWGGKYPPFNHDNLIPSQIAKFRNLSIISPGIIMEGGSLEVNGKGTLLTTRACLLNKNRNPHLTQAEIEKYLSKYLGVSNILWLEDGIVGDDTDGHIDDLSRFVNENTIVTVVESNQKDENYHILKENLDTLKTFKDQDGKPFKIVELPMPEPVWQDEVRLPASYANFLIANGVVLVPVFKDKNDSRVLQILQQLFPSHNVIGINCRELVWGLGTIHCLSQQEPL